MKPQDLQRMCVVCRQVQPVCGLLRFVLSPLGTVVMDYRDKLPGRGVWVCANSVCLQKACQKGGFSRAFKMPLKLDLAAIKAEMNDVLQRAIMTNLGLALVAKQCVAGRDQVALAARQNPLVALLIASDLSERSLSDVNEDVAPLAHVSLRAFSKEMIGSALGRGETGVVGLFKGRITDRIVYDLNRYLGITETAKEGV